MVPMHLERGVPKSGCAGIGTSVKQFSVSTV